MQPSSYECNCQMIPCILSLLTWNNEETRRPPRREFTTTQFPQVNTVSRRLHISPCHAKEDLSQSRNDIITVITAFSLLKASLHSKPLYLLHPIKGTNVREERMLFFINEVFSFSDNSLCSSCSISSPTAVITIIPTYISTPSSIPLSFLPPLLSSFIHLNSETDRRYSRSIGKSKSVVFTST